MRKASYFGLCMIWICTAFFTLTGFSTTVYAAPTINIHAESAALIDVNSGRILYSFQGNKMMRIASLTKIMTAIVAIEHGKLSDQVKVKRSAYRKEGSSIYLQLNEKMSLQNMLYGLMLRSGNDAATAIAEHVGGSVEGFAYLMNQTAQMIGMTHSHFVNPHGLDANGHYSTAIDMAKLTAYALHNPIFQNVVKTKRIKVPNPNESWDYTWRNKNKMLSIYQGADGVKTGYTKKAGRCLVSSATRNGQQLAVVTLNDPADWADHTRLLNYGFKYFPLHTLINKGDTITNSNAVAGKSFYYPLSDLEVDQVTKKIVWYAAKSLDYRFGDMGEASFYLGKKEIGSIPLYEVNSMLLHKENHTAFSYLPSQFDTQKESASILSIFERIWKSLFSVRM